MNDETMSAYQGVILLAPVDDQVYRVLRNEIIHGELAPGAVLRLRELASRFQVSTTPVREALERLKSDGLCTQMPHRGTRVVALSIEELEDIYAVRMGLEGQAVRLGLMELDDAGIAQVRNNWRAARALWDADREPTLDEYFPLMNQIHMPCIEATRMPRIRGLILDYRRYAQRYVRAALTDLDVLRDDVAFQEDFVIACERRDPDEAERMMRALLEWTMEKVRGQMSA